MEEAWIVWRNRLAGLKAKADGWKEEQIGLKDEMWKRGSVGIL